MLDRIMDFVTKGGKREITKPIFIKDFSKDNNHLMKLQKLEKKVTDERVIQRIKQDINFMKAGIQGEANVAFELKHSLLPILCLHDIHLRYKEYRVQIDFIILTRKAILLFETKKLTGDIEINSDGDFIRLFKNKSGRIYKKEGIYSPISQNERHVRILEKILKEKKLIRKMPIKSYVILANPKTIINKSYAPKRIQRNIYKYDQLTNLIKKELQDKSNNMDVKEKLLFDIADFLLKSHSSPAYDYGKRYSIEIKDNIASNNKDKSNEKGSVNESKKKDLVNEPDEKIERLKQYRLVMAKKEKLRPYMIFTNREMEELIQKNPTTKNELLKVRGFGEKKVEKYGVGILEILKKS